MTDQNESNEPAVDTNVEAQVPAETASEAATDAPAVSEQQCCGQGKDSCTTPEVACEEKSE